MAWEADHPRTQALAETQEKCVVQWKQDAGYHRRSLAENAMPRLKPLFGEGVASRLFDAQVNAVYARIAAMNQMTDLGMPRSVRVGGHCVLRKWGKGNPALQFLYAPTPIHALESDIVTMDYRARGFTRDISPFKVQKYDI